MYCSQTNLTWQLNGQHGSWPDCYGSNTQSELSCWQLSAWTVVNMSGVMDDLCHEYTSPFDYEYTCTTSEMNTFYLLSPKADNQQPFTVNTWVSSQANSAYHPAGDSTWAAVLAVKALSVHWFFQANCVIESLMTFYKCMLVCTQSNTNSTRWKELIK